MGTFKKFKTWIRKKTGLTGVAEFVENPITANSETGWNELFSNKKFLKEYVSPERIKSYTHFLNIIEEKSVFINKTSVMDFGCGTGHLLLEISKRFPAIELSGADFSKESISFAKQLLPKASFSVQDIYSIADEFKNKYDLLICTEVLEHLLYPNMALSNLIPMLSVTNGTLILGVPNGRIDTYSGHINFWSLESWNVFLRENLSASYQIETTLMNEKRNILSIIKLARS